MRDKLFGLLIGTQVVFLKEALNLLISAKVIKIIQHVKIKMQKLLAVYFSAKMIKCRFIVVNVSTEEILNIIDMFIYNYIIYRTLVKSV